MNNNMPNNLNNGGVQGVNNGPLDPSAQASQQLVQGQSSVGQNPSMMQGQGGVVNGVPGVMQGQGNGMNQPGVMQGMVNQPKPQPVVMPGQSNSNINAQTMQVENNSQPSASVVQPNATSAGVNNAGVPNQINIPNSNPITNQINIPNSNVGDANGVKPVTPNQINIPNTQPVNNGSVMGQSMQQPNMGSISPQAGVASNVSQLGANINQPVQQPSVGQNVNQTMQQSSVGQNMNQPMQQPVGQPNGINNSQGQSSVMGQSMQQPNMGQINANTNNNFMQANTQPSNNLQGGIKPTSTAGTGMSAVSQTEVNHQAMPTDITLEEPKKKFPLSTREMIFVGLALISVIAAIIYYIV